MMPPCPTCDGVSPSWDGHNADCPLWVPTATPSVSQPAGHVLPMALFVHGRARTKGSMRPLGNRANGSVILTEQVKGSKQWRHDVAEAVLRNCGAVPTPTGPLRWWTPYLGAVSVRLVVWLPRPPGRTDPYPMILRDGDTDKYERNVGDALTDTKIIDDDAQIVHWDAWKLWVPNDGDTGIDLEVSAL